MKKSYFAFIIFGMLIFSSCQTFLNSSGKTTQETEEKTEINTNSLDVELSILEYDKEENDNDFKKFEYILELKSLGKDHIKINRDELILYETSNSKYKELQDENIEGFKKGIFANSDFKLITSGIFSTSGIYKVKKKHGEYIFRFKTSYKEKNLFEDEVFLTLRDRVNIKTRKQFSPIQVSEYKIIKVDESKKLDIYLQNENSNPESSFKNFDISIDFSDNEDLKCDKYYIKKHIKEKDVYSHIKNKDEFEMNNENREAKIRCDLTNYKNDISTKIGGNINFTHVIERVIKIS